MNRFWLALCATTLAGGMALAAGEALKPPEAPKPPMAGEQRPQPPKSGEASSIQMMLQRSKGLMAQCQQSLATAQSEENKKFLTDAIAKCKDLQTLAENAMVAVQEGNQETMRQAAAQLRDKQMDLMRIQAAVQTYREVEQLRSVQAERGKDDPQLNARVEKVIGLMKQRLELQNQMFAIDSELSKERRELGPIGRPPEMPRPPEPPRPPSVAPSNLPKTEGKPVEAK